MLTLTPNKSLDKRTTSRFIKSACERAGPFSVYYRSICKPYISSPKYVTECHLSPEVRRSLTSDMILGDCKPHEIYVQEHREPNGLQQAFYVGDPNYKDVKKISTSQTSASYYANHISIAESRQKAEQTGFVAMLVGEDHATGVFAKRILLHAEGATSTVDAVNGPSLYADPGHCVLCSNELVVRVTLSFSQTVLMNALIIIVLVLVPYRRGFPRVSVRRSCISQPIRFRFYRASSNHLPVF